MANSATMDDYNLNERVLLVRGTGPTNVEVRLFLVGVVPPATT